MSDDERARMTNPPRLAVISHATPPGCPNPPLAGNRAGDLFFKNSRGVGGGGWARAGPGRCTVIIFFFVRGPAGTYLFDLLAELRARGWDLVQFSMQHGRNEPTPYAPYFVDRVDYHEHGSLFDEAQVYRDLYGLKSSKVLSFGERKMLDNAKQLIVKELAVAKKWAEEKVEQELEKACA